MSEQVKKIVRIGVSTIGVLSGVGLSVASGFATGLASEAFIISGLGLASVFGFMLCGCFTNASNFRMYGAATFAAFILGYLACNVGLNVAVNGLGWSYAEIMGLKAGISIAAGLLFALIEFGAKNIALDGVEKYKENYHLSAAVILTATVAGTFIGPVISEALKLSAASEVIVGALAGVASIGVLTFLGTVVAGLAGLGQQLEVD